MSEPIKVGDLVQVVRCCCSGYVDSSATFFVTRLKNERSYFKCDFCKKSLPLGHYAMATELLGEGGVPVSWLKRIPPLSELESEQNKEELTA